MTVKTDYSEGQSRRNKMVAVGIPESSHENWPRSEENVRKMITDKLQMDHTKIEVESAHRSGKHVTSRSDRSRPILVKV
jgi:hypothetical protein